MRYIRKVTLPFVLLLIFCLPTVTSAADVPYGNYFVGVDKEVTDPTGVLATIYTPATYPTINTSPANSQFSSAWVMIGETSTGDQIQVGWAHEPEVTGLSYPLYFIAAHISGTYSEIRSTVGPARGSTHDYKVTMTPNGWEGYVGTTKIGTYPLATIIPDAVSWAAEVTNSTTYTPYIGTSSDPLKFSNVRFDTAASSGFITANLSNFYNDQGSSINYSTYANNLYWTSWNTGS